MLDLQADTRCGTTTIKSHPVSVPGIVRLDQSGNVNGRLWVLSPTGFEAMGALSLEQALAFKYCSDGPGYE